MVGAVPLVVLCILYGKNGEMEVVYLQSIRSIVNYLNMTMDNTAVSSLYHLADSSKYHKRDWELQATHGPALHSRRTLLQKHWLDAELGDCVNTTGESEPNYQSLLERL